MALHLLVFSADEAPREGSMEKLMPPLAAVLRRNVKEFRDGGLGGRDGYEASFLA